VKRILCATTITVLLASSTFAESELEKNFRKITGEIIENLQEFYPVKSTEKGIHKYDYRFTDYSGKSIRNQVSKLKKFETRLYKYGKSNLSRESRINLKLLKSNVDIALHDLNKVKWHVKNPYMYVNDAVNGIYLILASDYAPMSERVQNIIARFKAVPDLFHQAGQNLKNLPPVYITVAREMLTTGIDFYRTVEADLVLQFPELSSEIHTAASRAISSMQEFNQFLDRISPGEPDSFALGKKDFDYKLQYEYFLGYDSDSLLKLGEILFGEVQSRYNEYLAYLDSTQPNNDSVFTVDCIGKEELLDYYNWEVAQTKLFLKEHDIVTIPDDIGECPVVETPPFLTNVISSIAYQPPGAYSPVQTGYFYVRPISDSADSAQRAARYKYIHRRGFRGSVAHEAYPGHHLQFQMAARVDNPVRKWQENLCFAEGWALYGEEMMYENGFYGSDTRQYLNILWAIMFRAARIIVDVKLHTGQMTTDEAVQWMAEVLETDTGWLGIEVNRYTLTPTIPMCYLIGKREILKLRDAVKERQSENFVLKDFHDRLLAEGAVPPTLLWEIWDLR
jgi:uncharacterized protein (DUF885 family)